MTRVFLSYEHAREFFHLQHISNRADFHKICSEILPNLALQPKTYEAIARHPIEICSEWKWM